MIGSGFWQSCGSIQTHWHTCLTHSTTSWMDNLYRCEDQGENCLRLGNRFRTSLAHWPVRLHHKTEQGSAQGTTGNTLTFGKRHSLKSQRKRKGARSASTHSNGHRLTWFSSMGRQCYSERPAHNGHCFFLYLNCLKKHLVECYQAWNIPKLEEPASTEITPPIDPNLPLHVQRAHIIVQSSYRAHNMYHWSSISLSRHNQRERRTNT